MNVLLATDADWLVQDVVAALGGPDTSFTVCSEGRDVAGVVADRTAGGAFDIGLFDLQIGSMGGMAVTMSLRLDESSGRIPHVPIIMLLDRVADVFLARRSGADGWLVKPLDPLRLRRAVRAVERGETYHEGLVDGRVQHVSTAVTADPLDTISDDAAAEGVDGVEGADVVAAPSR